MNMNFITIKGTQIPFYKHESVKQEHYLKALQSQKFKNWVENFENQEVEIKSITLITVYMFGSNVGFINVVVDAFLNEKKLPGFVFIRGGSVAILLLVNNQMILTRQYRVPAGKYMLEAPAGMVDEELNFAGVASKELKEECGLDISLNEMTYLGSIYASAGGSDEQITLYSVEKSITPEKLQDIILKTHGCEKESEQITLSIQDFNWKNILRTQDSKLIACAGFYFAMKDQQQI